MDLKIESGNILACAPVSNLNLTGLPLMVMVLNSSSLVTSGGVCVTAPMNMGSQGDGFFNS